MTLLFPADAQRGLPPGGSLSFADEVRAAADAAAIEAFEHAVHTRSAQQHRVAWLELDDAQAWDVIEACRKAAPRSYVAYAAQAIRAYYSHAQVLGAIGSGAVPPFPHGNALPTPDWERLEHVYLRGPIYREAP